MELTVWNVVQLVSVGFVSWLVWGFIDALIIVGLKLDTLASKRVKILSMTLVSGLTYGLILTGALWLIDAPTNVWAFIAFTFIGLWSGYRQGKSLTFSS